MAFPPTTNPSKWLFRQRTTNQSGPSANDQPAEVGHPPTKNQSARQRPINRSGSPANRKSAIGGLPANEEAIKVVCPQRSIKENGPPARQRPTNQSLPANDQPTKAARTPAINQSKWSARERTTNHSKWLVCERPTTKPNWPARQQLTRGPPANHQPVTVARAPANSNSDRPTRQLTTKRVAYVSANGNTITVKLTIANQKNGQRGLPTNSQSNHSSGVVRLPTNNQSKRPSNNQRLNQSTEPARNRPAIQQATNQSIFNRETKPNRTKWAAS